MATVDSDVVLARLAASARAIHRFSSRGALAGVLVGAITFLALYPWLSGSGAALAVGLVLLLVLVAAPLRVVWHGRKITAAYGDPATIEATLAEVPGALEEATVALRGIVAPSGRGLRRVVSAWRSLRALQDVWQGSPVRGRLDRLIEPVRPEALAVTSTAIWATLATLVLGPPIAAVSLLALAVT